MAEQLPEPSFAALGRLNTAAACNAIEHFRIRLRNEGYVDGSIPLRTTVGGSMLGYAVTVQMRTDIPPTSGVSYLERNDWWDAIGRLPQPTVIVVADVGGRQAAGSVAGEAHITVFKALGAVGIVTDGAVRDMAMLRKLGMHVYARSVVPSHAYAHIVAVGVPVTLGGLAIDTGDLLLGDEDGIVKIPPAIAAELPRVAGNLSREESALLARFRTPNFSIAKLRAELDAFTRKGRSD